MGFQQGLSGLSVAAKTLDVIGNNIANAAVAGFKSSSVQFGDLYADSLGGAGATPVGIGALVQSVAQQFTQGNITNTNNPLDVAIHGNGFFRLEDKGVVTYSRNGQFHLEKDGTIANASGNKLTGWPVGMEANQDAKDIKILSMNLEKMPPLATSKVIIGMNLNAGSDILEDPTATFDPDDSTTYTNSTSATIYDTLGGQHAATIYFGKTGPGAYDVNFVVDGVSLPADKTSITFDSFGKNNTTGLTPKLVTPISSVLPLVPAAGTILASPFTLDMTSWTQYDSSFSVSKLVQDGYSAGVLANFAVTNNGQVMAHYDNGQTRSMGSIVLANFESVNGLQSDGANQWKQTFESGNAFLGIPGDSSFGDLQSSAIEDSNVDLTTQLVDMITAQRIYQANAQSIKTQDQVLQTLVNLR